MTTNFTSNGASGAHSSLPNSFAAELWRIGAPDEWAYFSALCHSIDEPTFETLDRLRVSDWSNPTSALIHRAAVALRARGESLNAETLADECARVAGECDRQSEVPKWENAGEACDALNTSRAAKGNPDKIAVQLAEKIAPKQRFNLSSLSEVMARPDPEFLINRILTLGGTSLMTAKHASFKSFIALDMALSVATGRAWHGFNVRRGAVVYVAAEGASGIKKRARAWLDFHGEPTPENFVVLDVPLQIADEATRAAFIAEIAALSPSLIILDTLARCAVGLDENSSRDMGSFADALGALARESGAHVMTVHHNNKTGEYRGSTAVPAAVDTHLSLERTGERVKLEMPKQKDADEILPITFEKNEVSIPDSRGQSHSLVFTKMDNDEGGDYSLSSIEEKLIEELIGAFGDEGATASQWSQVCEAVGIPNRTFRRAKEKLSKVGAIECPDKGARGARFTVSSSWGHDDLAPTLDAEIIGEGGNVNESHA